GAMAAENSPEQQQTSRVPVRPWPKGVSGNPGGRPRVVGRVKELARQWTAAAIQTLASVRQDPWQPARARVAAAEALLDRGYGKPTQPIAGDDTMDPILVALEQETLRAFLAAVAARQNTGSGNGGSPTA